MAKFTYFLLFVYITLILSSFVLADPPKGKKPPSPLETIVIKASKVGKNFTSKRGTICVSFKSALKSKDQTTAELFRVPKSPKSKGLGKLKFPNDRKIHKKSFPKQKPGRFVIEYTFESAIATVLIKERRASKCKKH